MKVQILFESSDFTGCGQMIVRQSSPLGAADIGFMASVSYKICWKSNQKGPNTIFKVSLSDGMCIEYKNIQELCSALNGDTFGYRPMSEKEIQQVIKHVGNRFNQNL